LLSSCRYIRQENYALKSIDAVRKKLEHVILYIERNPKTAKSIASFLHHQVTLEVV
jgi:hypothetical protein